MTYLFGEVITGYKGAHETIIDHAYLNFDSN